MQDDALSPSSTFPTGFQDQTVECRSLIDAEAVKTANDIFRDDAAHDYSPRELDRLAAVLDRYNLKDSAESLANVSRTMRAAHFLVDAAGYERPTRRAED